jgi:hypothetical protein
MPNQPGINYEIKLIVVGWIAAVGIEKFKVPGTGPLRIARGFISESISKKIAPRPDHVLR